MTDINIWNAIRIALLDLQEYVISGDEKTLQRAADDLCEPCLTVNDDGGYYYPAEMTAEVNGVEWNDRDAWDFIQKYMSDDREDTDIQMAVDILRALDRKFASERRWNIEM